MLAAVMGVAAGVVVAAVVACEAVSAATVCTSFVGDPTPASLWVAPWASGLRHPFTHDRRGTCSRVAGPPPNMGEHRKGSMLAWVPWVSQ
jgi:hypothetical protein